jgi:hypothetical protein
MLASPGRRSSSPRFALLDGEEARPELTYTNIVVMSDGLTTASM